MQPLTATGARRWCDAQGLAAGRRGFPEPRSTPSDFRIPSDAGKRVALVNRHLYLFEGAAEILVWFDDWAVWPSGQRMHVFERVLASYGHRAPLIEQPAFLFSAAEYDDAVSFVTIGVLFLWDVHVVDAGGQHLVFYSHDELGWTAGL